MKEEKQVFSLSAVKLGRKKTLVLPVIVNFQSRVSLRLLDLTIEIVRPQKQQKHDMLFA